MLCGMTSAAKGQSFDPGGVKGAIQWYVADSAHAGLGSCLAGGHFLSFDHAAVSSLNFHPSLVFPGGRSVSIDMEDLRSASYFTVYQSSDTSGENSIWHIDNGGQAALILTTDRMADLAAYKYMNYRDVVRSEPKVKVYVQHKDSAAVTVQQWTLGGKPVTPQLPVTDLKGMVPEIIAYNRVLNSRERLQVASYLSLKYGITLTEPGATYLNSAGEEIWNGYDYKAWHHNIAGICRDDSAGLNQFLASSSNMPGLLTIASHEALDNNTFLLWGDNGQPLTNAPKTAGLPSLLKRTWLMKTYGTTRPFITDLTINTRAIDAPLPVSPVYWLVVDPTGAGQFTALTTQFIKMDELDAQGLASFKKLVWDKDGSGKDVWGIIAGTDMLVAATIDQPTCTPMRTGSLQIRIIGGQSPYQLLVQNSSGLLVNKSIDQANTPEVVNDLPPGKYFLKAVDARQHMYTDSFYIQNQDVPSPQGIAAAYALSGGRPLQLDASPNMPDGLSWEWDGPGNIQSFSPQITITTPGLYTLHCSRNGCTNTQDVTVTAPPANTLYDVTVYPNPSQGTFSVRIRLDDAAPVTMSVYDPEGRLITMQKDDARQNHLFTGRLDASGVYELVFTSGLSQANKKLVIAK